MHDRTETLFYSAVGPMAALLLGVAFMPLRGMTPASNFSIAFLVLTIVAGELGGGWAAVTTALTSSLSLDFFLTQPYLRLSMYAKDDVIAFIGMTVCGLVAAAFAARRGEGIRARRQLRLLRSVLGRLDQATPLESRVAAALDECLERLPVAGLRVRDMQDRVIARVGRTSSARSTVRLDLDLLQAEPALSLPLDGALIPLAMENYQVGWLEVWGAGARSGLDPRQTLAAVAHALAAVLAASPRAVGV